jgi:hypothetical protein
MGTRARMVEHADTAAGAKTAGPCLAEETSRFLAIPGRTEAGIDWRKVHRARLRLAAGDYERDDVFDPIVDRILHDLS